MQSWDSDKYVNIFLVEKEIKKYNPNDKTKTQLQKMPFYS